jgi:hypothetical protein
VYGIKEMIETGNEVMKLHDKEFYLTYDTTFTLGDYYKSILLMRNVIFKSMPPMPILFLLHKKKLTSCHKIFFDQFSKLFPKHKGVPIVVDDERAISKAIEDQTDLTIAGCWHHLGESIERWVSSAGGPKNDQAFYRDEVFELLRLASEEEFQQAYEAKSEKWSDAFVDYFSTTVTPNLPRFASWELQDKVPLHPETGITTNLSEGMNFLIKDLMSWKEVPEDVILLSMRHLQQYYICESLRGKAGLGTYELRGKYIKFHVPVDEINLPFTYSNPQDIYCGQLCLRLVRHII